MVPGDIIYLDAGARVPADARLLPGSTNVACTEAALTGESVPCAKDASLVLPADAILADRHNMLYASCLVTSGAGSALVTATGDANEIGRINKMMMETEGAATPLLVQLDRFGKWLSVAVLAVAVITFLVAYLARDNALGASFQIAVAVAGESMPWALHWSPSL